MFDKYLIVEGSLRNVEHGGVVTGFSMSVKLGYYRGIGLSMVEELGVSIDGAAVERSAIRFDEGGGWIGLDAMETAYDRRWGFGQVADLFVARDGGLSPGMHEVDFTERLRVSYLPFPAVNSDRKTMHVA